jgi:hypothetical protein
MTATRVTATFYVRMAPGQDWHIEGPDVEIMLCGVEIGTDGGEVRTKRPVRICAACCAAADREEEAVVGERIEA